MTTVRSLLTGLFLGLPFLVAPAILFAAPRPDVAAVAETSPMGLAPAATLAASPAGTLKVIPAKIMPAHAGGLTAVPGKATTTIIKAHAGRSVPRQLIAMN